MDSQMDWLSYGCVVALLASTGCVLSDQSIGEDSAADGESTADGSSGDGGDDGGSETDGGDVMDDGSDDVLDDDATGDDTGSDCTLAPLDEELLNSLSLYSNPLRKVAQNGSVQIQLGALGPGGVDPVPACVEWSVIPEAAASIDETGLLRVAPDAQPGLNLTVEADIENGREVIATDVTVYVPSDAPIVGSYHEVSWIECAGGATVDSQQPIGEVIFYETGDFWVTWTPFELYVDYWGTWTWDDATSTVTMNQEGGNYVPEDLDLEGTVTIVEDPDGIVLEAMWLGTPPDADPPITECGHVLER